MTAPIDQALGRSGQKTGDVYRVGFPRTGLHVSVNGVAIKPGLALGSWAAVLGTDDKVMVMGDLVLLEEELNPVMGPSGFEITAVHNHLMEETPTVLYMHYMRNESGFPERRLAHDFSEYATLPGLNSTGWAWQCIDAQFACFKAGITQTVRRKCSASVSRKQTVSDWSL